MRQNQEAEDSGAGCMNDRHGNALEVRRLFGEVGTVQQVHRSQRFVVFGFEDGTRVLATGTLMHVSYRPSLASGGIVRAASIRLSSRASDRPGRSLVVMLSRIGEYRLSTTPARVTRRGLGWRLAQGCSASNISAG